MKNQLLIILCVFLLITACNPLKEKLQGGWVIDQAYYHEVPVMWDLYSNALTLRPDNTCHLPIDDWAYRHTEKEQGIWKVLQQSDSSYLRIETENRIFDRTFQILDLRKVKDMESGGFLMKMTLAADSLKMDCTRAIY